jgi:uncharacterized protein YlxW (UPF0749 family)
MGLFPTSLLHEAIQPSERRLWWTSLCVLCAVLGGMLALSFNTQNRIRQQDLPSSNYSGLAEGYRFLKKQVEDQQRTIAALQKNTTKLENSTASDTKQAQALADDLNHARFLAGLTDVKGPGLVVTLNDSKKRFPDAPTVVQMAGIIHDTDINQAVNELKAAGAEAIAVNGQRLVATSPIRCAGPTVYVNNTPQTPPYVIKAIGEPKTLQKALDLPGGVADTLKQMDSAMIKSEKVKMLTVPAYAGATQPRYAKPVAAPGSGEEPRDSKARG